MQRLAAGLEGGNTKHGTNSKEHRVRPKTCFERLKRAVAQIAGTFDLDVSAVLNSISGAEQARIGALLELPQAAVRLAKDDWSESF